ncbi:MAG: dicarboxylate/amino acid:cation symporter [Rhodospirillales bacterium]|nr:dicarboxylate/amino acid:cation symporter [Rhodospirillales bacterium]
MWKTWSSIKLWKRIAGGLILGVIVGIAMSGAPGVVDTWIKPFGTLFLNFIKMLIVPLVFLSLVVGVTSLKDPARMGRIGIKTVGWYLVTTAFAVVLGLVFALVFQPGTGVEKVAAAAPKAAALPSVVDTFLNLVPTNPVGALASGNILQIIVFAIVVGIAINFVGPKADPLERVMQAGADVMYKMTAGVMELAPLGVFALMAWVAAKYGLSILLPLAKIIVCVYVACILHAIVVYGLILKLYGGLNPVQFFKGIVDAQMVAFTTTSSAGTLPVTLRCTQDNLGVSVGVSSFVLPLGATINMDGTAIYEAIAAVFVAQVFGVTLGGGDYLMIVIVATLASIGAAGVPGAGLIMLTMVLTTIGLPLEGLAIVAGIDRILDMARTTINVTGDAMVSCVVAKSEGELNKAVYDAAPVA